MEVRRFEGRAQVVAHARTNPVEVSAPKDPGLGKIRCSRRAKSARPDPLRAARLRFDLAAGRDSFACARAAHPHYLPGTMARGDVRIAVTLACEECKRRNYQTEKSKRNNPDRVEFRKYCRWCGKHTPHKETR